MNHFEVWEHQRHLKNLDLAMNESTKKNLAHKQQFHWMNKCFIDKMEAKATTTKKANKQLTLHWRQLCGKQKPLHKHPTSHKYTDSKVLLLFPWLLFKCLPASQPALLFALFPWIHGHHHYITCCSCAVTPQQIYKEKKSSVNVCIWLK